MKTWVIDTYAVIGNPISHSKSPFIHTLFAQQTGQNMQYIAIESPLDKFSETVLDFKNRGGKGCNVTMPFKQQAFKIAQQHSARANQVEAVNTLVIEKNGNIFGDNTDGVGLARDLKNNHNIVLTNQKILIIGAGGAVRGIILPLLLEQPQLLFIANRTPKKAELLAKDFAEFGNVSGGGFSDLKDKEFDLIINATSAGLKKEELVLPDSLITPETICYDLSYPMPTLFLDWAKSMGAIKCIDGIGMLIEQAAESFYLWRNVRPDTKKVMAYFLRK